MEFTPPGVGAEQISVKSGVPAAENEVKAVREASALVPAPLRPLPRPPLALHKVAPAPPPHPIRPNEATQTNQPPPTNQHIRPIKARHLINHYFPPPDRPPLRRPVLVRTRMEEEEEEEEEEEAPKHKP